MSDTVVAYNFMAAKLGWPVVSDDADLSTVLISARIPIKRSDAVRADDLQVLSSVYSVLGAAYFIKVTSGVVTEFYRRNATNRMPDLGVSLDLVTNQILERYTDDGVVERKYDATSGALLAENPYVTFETLPEDIKIRVAALPRKDKIRMYGRKPYGDIVEVWAD